MSRIVYGHHFHRGERDALRGREPDKRKRTPANAEAYADGYVRGKAHFRLLAAHGMLQKIDDALAGIS